MPIGLADGGTLSASHYPGKAGPVVVLLHGLGGSTHAPYMRVALAAALKRGNSVVALNHRGSDAELERSDLPYMAGNTSDLTDVLRWVRDRYPQRTVFMVGFSLSGNTLLKWLGERSTDLPEAALAVCPAVDLEATSKHLVSWPQHAYDLWILQACRRWVPRLRGRDHKRYRVPALSSLREFDQRYIAPVWGFPDRESYYREASSAAHLVNIECPTAILAAADDPIASIELLRRAPRSQAVALHIEAHGGHLGFLAAGRGPLGTHRWLEYAIDHYIAAVEKASAAAPLSPRSLSPCAP